ncbi:hypothetical protein [Tsukamurella soli]|uniref:Uncharacterized protein n=1 Tax=Tsukamurella soli TaxID=644556 RepID=A0ABP8JIZ3_9ACTN
MTADDVLARAAAALEGPQIEWAVVEVPTETGGIESIIVRHPDGSKVSTRDAVRLIESRSLVPELMAEVEQLRERERGWSENLAESAAQVRVLQDVANDWHAENKRLTVERDDARQAVGGDRLDVLLRHEAVCQRAIRAEDKVAAYAAALRAMARRAAQWRHADTIWRQISSEQRDRIKRLETELGSTRLRLASCMEGCPTGAPSPHSGPAWRDKHVPGRGKG